MARSWSEPCHRSYCGWWHLIQVSRPTYCALAITSAGTTEYQSQANTPAAANAQMAKANNSTRRVAKRNMNQSVANESAAAKGGQLNCPLPPPRCPLAHVS